jgi:type IV pilus assembly protein PilA
MGENPDTVGSDSAIAKGWLWVVRIAALVPALAVVAYNVRVWLPAVRVGCADDHRPAAMACVVLAIPHFVCLRYLWSKSLKLGLAWAVVTGGFWFALPFFIFTQNIAFGLSRVVVAMGVLWLWHATLAGAAIRLYYSLPREDGDRRILWGRILRFVPYIAAVFMILFALPGLLRSRIAAAQAAAVGALRTIHMAEEAYQEQFKSGFSPTLRSLGPPAPGEPPGTSGAGLIDEKLAAGERSAYTLTYHPGPPDSAGRIAAFTITAAPSDSACTGWQRYFADETGVVRWTPEDRPATRDDPKLK